MTISMSFARAVAEGARRGGLALFCLAGLCAIGAAGWLARPAGSPTGGADGVAERYSLPITAPLDQGDTGLCWVFATLSMLETNYMSRHPGAHVEFSRASLQADALDDRFRRLVRGEPGAPSDGGLAIEALDLIRQDGLIERADFHDVVDAQPLLTTLEATLAEPGEPQRKAQEVDEEIAEALGAKPATTHLEGRPVSPATLASAALADRSWTEFDLTRDGATGWGPSRDPDARAGTRVRYARLATLIDLIHRSLRRGEAAVVGTLDHALMVYGAEYDRAGAPLAYLVKDSLAPYVYRLDAERLHEKLNDVTVADGVGERDLADDAATPPDPPRL